MLFIQNTLAFGQQLMFNPCKTICSCSALVVHVCSLYVYTMILCKPFQPSLIFIGNAKSLLKRGVHERCSSWAGSGFTQKYYSRLERLAKEKKIWLIWSLHQRQRNEIYKYLNIFICILFLINVLAILVNVKLNQLKKISTT